MRLAYYAGASTAAAAACLLKAFHQRPNFYSATVYLAQSNACLLILTNLLLVTACSFLYGLQRLLYGPLRPIEMEQLSEKAWYAVLDTLLAMPSFREDVGGWLLTMFVLLLAGKVWGWIGEGRVEILEQQPPANPRLFHARLATSLILSVAFDLWMLDYCVETVMADPRPGMMVIFTFEFAVLSIFSMFTLSRYCLSLVQIEVERRQMKDAIEVRKSEIRAERVASRLSEMADGQPAPAPVSAEDEPIEVDENEIDIPGWEEKRRYLFALEVFTDFVKLVIYIVFFTVSITFNGLPMHIMRDVYMTFASFSKRVSDYVAYRKATSDMNTRYPDATTEEIRGDACIVCRESMVSWEQPTAAVPGAPPQADGQQPPATAPTPPVRRDEGLRAKKLPCNHILHLRCLKAWLERQQVCPTCRRPVITPAETAQPGRPGAPHANAAAPGQAGQPQQARPPRARIFNLGPVRIGFLNGPADQFQNVVQQIRNPLAAQNAGALPAARGPNHLGLQVPYANDLQPTQQRAIGGAAAGAGARAAVPMQIQMMQMEQRLLQDAHNLGIEQQQLTTLRMMEAELARLRATHMPRTQPVGVANATQRQQLAVQQQMAGLGLPLGLPLTQPQLFAPPPMDMTLRGTPAEQLSSGHESLPQGLVLPEGWTAMPMYRASASGNATQINMHALQTAASRTAPSAPPIQTTTNGAASGSTIQPAVVDSVEPQPEARGPTDGNGSPLFVPTTASMSPNIEQASSAVLAAEPVSSTPDQQQQSIPSPKATQSQRPAQSQPAAQTENKTPWTANDGWSFVPPNSDSSTDGHSSELHGGPEALGDGSASVADDRARNDKGKGRAVELEDVPDTES